MSAYRHIQMNNPNIYYRQHREDTPYNHMVLNGNMWSDRRTPEHLRKRNYELYKKNKREWLDEIY